MSIDKVKDLIMAMAQNANHLAGHISDTDKAGNALVDKIIELQGEATALLNKAEQDFEALKTACLKIDQLRRDYYSCSDTMYGAIFTAIKPVLPIINKPCKSAIGGQPCWGSAVTDGLCEKCNNVAKKVKEISNGKT